MEVNLPEEILVHIFSYYVLTEKQGKLVSVLRKVCKSWEHASKNSQLWKTFDGTVLYADFLKMCKSNELQNTQEVIFSKVAYGVVKRCDLDIIFSNLPSLKKINFSQVVKVQALFFTCLRDQCPNLCEIVLRNEFDYYCRKLVPISRKMVNYLKHCGSKLTHLDISYSSLSNVHKLFLVISDSCSNLKELIAKHIEYASTEKKFPIGPVQRGCPKLKVLCLGMPMEFDEDSWDPSNGFPELEVFTHKTYKSTSYNEVFTNELLYKLLSHSNKLKVLDLRGCKYFSADDLLSLPATDLQKLYISETSIYPDAGDCPEFLKKWQHSLVKLDFTATYYYDKVLRNGFWICLENLESVKVLVRTDPGAADFYRDSFIKNCRNLKSLEIQGSNKRMRLR